MNAIFSPSTCWILYGGKIGSPCSSSSTFAARYWKTEPKNGVPSWQPSTGWQPWGASASRCSGPVAELHPQQLGAALVELVVADADGSRRRSSSGTRSWARRGRGREQRRAADHVAGADNVRVGFSEPSAFMCVAKYSAPPAEDGRSPTPPVGSSIRPSESGGRLEMAVEVVERQAASPSSASPASTFVGRAGARRRDDRECGAASASSVFLIFIPYSPLVVLPTELRRGGSASPPPSPSWTCRTAPRPG